MNEKKGLDRFYGPAVALVAILVYANSLGNGFVWDDTNVIVNNEALRNTALALFRGVDTAGGAESPPYYRPLTILSFLVEERLHGLTPFPMHLFNVLLHAANAFLVYRLARSLVDDTMSALFAALLFAVHPIHAESINFLSGGRNTLLACFFPLIGYLLHQRSVIRGSRATALAGASAFLAGLFCKETALAILPFIAACEADAFRARHLYKRINALIRLAPYAVAATLYLFMRDSVLSGAGVQISILPGLGERLLNNFYIIPRYLLSIIWPFAISSRYYLPDDIHLTVPLLVPAWIGILILLIRLLAKDRSRATIFSMFWIAAFLAPVSGIVPIPSAPLADRYLYMPAIGLWIIVGDHIGRLSSFSVRFRQSVLTAAVIVLLTFGAATVARNAVWKNDISLFSHYVEQYPERAFGHGNLGCAYLDQEHNLDRAEQEFEKAFMIDPSFPRLRTQMGYVRLLRGDSEGALRHYDAALLLNPFDAEALLNTGIALESMGRTKEAAGYYSRFLRVPGNELPVARAQIAERLGRQK